MTSPEMDPGSPNIVRRLEEIYGEQEAIGQKQRYDRLAGLFKEAFGHDAEIKVRAPGRVNIIGEHIDYSGYGVFPATIGYDIIAFASFKAVDGIRQEGKGLTINVRNTNDTFRPTSILFHGLDDFKVSSLDEETADTMDTSWITYFTSAWKTFWLECKTVQKTYPSLGTLSIYIDGRIPPASGLSSSAAFLVSTMLVFDQTFGANLTKMQLKELSINAEHAAGVMSGGMDQSASILGDTATALHIILFQPFQYSTVQLPSNATLVIGHSGVTCAKMEGVKEDGAPEILEDSLNATRCIGRYNERVWECQVACHLLDPTLRNAQGEAATKAPSLADMQYRLFGFPSTLPERIHGLKKMVAKTHERLTQEEGYTLKDLIDQGIPNDLLQQRPATITNIYRIKQRALHVFEESLRVEQFSQILATQPSPDSNATMKQLGTLMNASHDSCRDFFECSCKSLDYLVNCFRQAGAYGARLTGAGWGGCAVALIDASRVDQFLKDVNDSFYTPQQERRGSKMNTTLFACIPTMGACILRD